jgi:hypothetical protein
MRFENSEPAVDRAIHSATHLRRPEKRLCGPIHRMQSKRGISESRYWRLCVVVCAGDFSLRGGIFRLAPTRFFSTSSGIGIADADRDPAVHWRLATGVFYSGFR